MNKYDNNGGSGGKPGSSMRRLLTDGTPTQPMPPEPILPAPPAQPFSRRLAQANFGQYLIPGVLVVILLIGVAIMAYSFGVSRGRGSANAARDAFYEGRQQSWDAAATALATNPNVATTAAPGQTDAATQPTGYTLGSALFARVDKIEGDQLTLLLLDETGKPNNNTLIVKRTKQTQVWRLTPNQPVELKPGDSVLVAGERTNDSFNARSIQVLPTNS